MKDDMAGELCDGTIQAVAKMKLPLNLLGLFRLQKSAGGKRINPEMFSRLCQVRPLK